MACQYTVVQFIPDPIADERLNIGIIAFNKSEIATAFLHDWGKVEAAFGQFKVNQAKDFEREIKDTIEKGEIDAAGMEHIIGQNLSDIELTSPRGSTYSEPKELIEQIRHIFLKENTGG